MKLICPDPCLNEEATLPATLKDIARSIPGIDQVEILIIDDGCTDHTVEVAREGEVDHILTYSLVDLAQLTRDISVPTR